VTLVRRLGVFRTLSLLPFIVIVVLFGLYPFARVVVMSFSRVVVMGGGMRTSWVGAENFIRALGSASVRHSLLITFAFVIASTILSVALGTTTAILTDRATRIQGLAQNVLVWPAIIAPVVVSVLWVLILNPQIGVLNTVLGILGLPQQGLLGSGSGALAAVIAVDVWHWTPLVYLLVYSALKGIDPEILEAASLDGASAPRAVRHVILPMLAPALLAALALRTVMGVKVFDEMYLLTRGGPGDSTTIISLLIRGIVFDDVDLGYGSAVSLVTVGAVLVVALLVLATRRTLRRRP
jgi:multiple sugar transport system permease protein